jgi:hypothetical protein
MIDSGDTCTNNDSTHLFVKYQQIEIETSLGVCQSRCLFNLICDGNGNHSKALDGHASSDMQPGTGSAEGEAKQAHRQHISQWL